MADNFYKSSSIQEPSINMYFTLKKTINELKDNYQKQKTIQQNKNIPRKNDDKDTLSLHTNYVKFIETIVTTYSKDPVEEKEKEKVVLTVYQLKDESILKDGFLYDDFIKKLDQNPAIKPETYKNTKQFFIGLKNANRIPVCAYVLNHPTGPEKYVGIIECGDVNNIVVLPEPPAVPAEDAEDAKDQNIKYNIILGSSPPVNVALKSAMDILYLIF